MKKILLITAVLFCSFFANAQSEQNLQKAKIVNKDKVIPYQMGNAQTEKGTYTIVFDTSINEDYTVTITPYSASTTLYVSEKTKDKLVIKTSDGSDISFDYVIFIKRTMLQN